MIKEPLHTATGREQLNADCKQPSSLPVPESGQSHDKALSGIQKAQFSTRLLDLHAAGEYLGMSFWTVRDLVIAGKIPRVRIPHPYKKGRYLRLVRVDIRDLDAFITKYKWDGAGV